MKLSDVEKLIKLVEESNIAELEVQFNRRQKIRVSKVAGQPVTPAIPVTPVTYLSGVPASSTPAAAEETKETKPSRPSNIVAIKSPMVGTFYRASAPDAPPYVEVGDTVKPGTVVCIVEAMKLMNEIESEVSGRVAEILVENETPVEYGQELFLIEPS